MSRISLTAVCVALLLAVVAAGSDWAWGREAGDVPAAVYSAQGVPREPEHLPAAASLAEGSPREPGQLTIPASPAEGAASRPGSARSGTSRAQDMTVRRLELVGELGGGATAVVVDGNTAYLGIGGRVVVLGVSTPSRPAVLAETARLATEIADLDVSDGFLYVLDTAGVLVTVDVRVADAPAPVGSLALGGTPLRMAVGGGFVAVACGDLGLAVVDSADPSAPRLVGTLGTRLSTRDVAISGAYAFLAERDPWEAGVRVVDLTNKEAPEERAFLYTPGGADALALRDEHAFVLGTSGVMWVVDVSDAEQPARLGVYGDVPPRQASIPDSGPPARDLALAGDYVLIARDTAGLDVVDVRFLGRPLKVATIDTPGAARAVAVHGWSRPHALVADWDHGMRVIDLSDESVPVEVASYETPGSIVGIDAADDLVAVADRGHGLRTISIADPARPAMLGSVRTKGTPTSVRILVRAGASSPLFAMVGETPRYTIVRQGRTSRGVYEGGLAQVDLRRPAVPRIVAEIDDIYATSLAVTLGTLHVGAGRAMRGVTPGQPNRYNGLLRFSLDPPRDPKLLSSLELPGPVTGVAVSASAQIVLATAHGVESTAVMHVIDVARPYGPSPVSSFSTGTDRASDVDLEGDLALIATSSDATGGGVRGLQVVDVRDPAAPALAGAVELPDGGIGVRSLGEGLAAAIDGEGAIVLIDLADPGNPVLVDRYVHPGATGLALAADGPTRLYVGASPATFLVLGVVDLVVTPTPTPTATSTPTSTPTATATATATHTPEPQRAVHVPFATR